MSSLGLMCFEGKLDLVREAIGQGEDVNDKSFNDKTGLILAVWKKYNLIVKLLLEQPTLDLNCIDNTGSTALHIAASSDNVEGVRLLLADPRLNTHNHKNNRGCTPVMVAMSHNKVNALHELIAHPSVDLDTNDNQGDSLEDFARWVSQNSSPISLTETSHLFVAGTWGMKCLSNRLVKGGEGNK